MEQQDYNKSYCPSMILTILDNGYSCVNKDEKRVSIQVSRGHEDIELSGMEITFYNTDTSWVEFISKNSKFYDFPESNEEKVFTISYPPTENAPQSASVSAVVILGNDQITCDATDTVQLEDC